MIDFKITINPYLVLDPGSVSVRSSLGEASFRPETVSANSINVVIDYLPGDDEVHIEWSVSLDPSFPNGVVPLKVVSVACVCFIFILIEILFTSFSTAPPLSLGTSHCHSSWQATTGYTV